MYPSCCFVRKSAKKGWSMTLEMTCMAIWSRRSLLGFWNCTTTAEFTSAAFGSARTNVCP